MDFAVEVIETGVDGTMMQDSAELNRSRQNGSKGGPALPVEESSVCSGTTRLIGGSRVMRDLRSMIRDVARTDATVLIIGESGTGKELVARAIHDCSDRCNDEFVPVNMAALPDSLVESVLFGHEKGAFTGAESRQAGLCQQADGGTLFLDEISEMQRDLQPKLLRFLQEYTFQRVGSTRTERTNVRIISATNRDPQEMIESGCFREDLYFRLNVIPIHLPPLRDRREDIPELVRNFAANISRRTGRKATFSGGLLRRLQGFEWPGNVRQLQNLVERMVILAKSEMLTESHLPVDFQLSTSRPDTVSSRVEGKHTSAAVLQPVSATSVVDRDDAYATDSDADDRPQDAGAETHSKVRQRQSFAEMEFEPVFVGDRFLTRMELIERESIIDALTEHSGNVTAAARFLGLGPATVYRKIRSYGICGFTNVKTENVG